MEEKWPVYLDDWRIGLFTSAHDGDSCSSCFGSLFIDLNEGLVNDLGHSNLSIRYLLHVLASKDSLNSKAFKDWN